MVKPTQPFEGSWVVPGALFSQFNYIIEIVVFKLFEGFSYFLIVNFDRGQVFRKWVYFPVVLEFRFGSNLTIFFLG